MEYRRLIELMLSMASIKKFTPVILSVSVFSFMFSNSSWHSFLFRFFQFYSSLPIQVVSHALDKSWIFLICIGILVVIANTSGMVHSPSGSDLNDLLQKKIGDGLQAPPDNKVASIEVPEPENAVHEEEKENHATEDEEENSCLIMDVDEEEQVQESQLLQDIGGEGGAETQEVQITSVMADHIEENEEESETSFMMEKEDDQQYDDYDEEEEEEEEEEEGIDELSTEELNKKFDDFIRKMKEELRVDAQQQLVLVK